MADELYLYLYLGVIGGAFIGMYIEKLRNPISRVAIKKNLAERFSFLKWNPIAVIVNMNEKDLRVTECDAAKTRLLKFLGGQYTINLSKIRMLRGAQVLFFSLTYPFPLDMTERFERIEIKPRSIIVKNKDGTTSRVDADSWSYHIIEKKEEDGTTSRIPDVEIITTSTFPRDAAEPHLLAQLQAAEQATYEEEAERKYAHNKMLQLIGIGASVLSLLGVLYLVNAHGSEIMPLLHDTLAGVNNLGGRLANATIQTLKPI